LRVTLSSDNAKAVFARKYRHAMSGKREFAGRAISSHFAAGKFNIGGREEIKNSSVKKGQRQPLNTACKEEGKAVWFYTRRKEAKYMAE